VRDTTRQLDEALKRMESRSQDGGAGVAAMDALTTHGLSGNDACEWAVKFMDRHLAYTRRCAAMDMPEETLSYDEAMTVSSITAAVDLIATGVELGLRMRDEGS